MEFVVHSQKNGGDNKSVHLSTQNPTLTGEGFLPPFSSSFNSSDLVEIDVDRGVESPWTSNAVNAITLLSQNYCQGAAIKQSEKQQFFSGNQSAQGIILSRL